MLRLYGSYPLCPPPRSPWQAALLCGALSEFTRDAVAAAAAAVAVAASADGPAPEAPPPSQHQQQQQQQQQAPGVVLFGDFNSLAQKWLPDRFDPQVGGELGISLGKAAQDATRDGGVMRAGGREGFEKRDRGRGDS